MRIFRHYLLAILVIISALAASTAIAGGPDKQNTDKALYESFYGGLHGGMAIPAGSTGAKMFIGLNAGGQIGIKFNTNLRFEIAGTYYRHTYKRGITGSFQAGSAMGNILYTYPVSNRVLPYFGLGIGYLYEDIPNSAAVLGSRTGDYSAFAYQGIGGVDYQFQKNMTLGVQYRLITWTGGDNIWDNLISLVINYYV